MRSAALGVALLVAVVSGCSAEAEPAEVGPLASGTASASASASAGVRPPTATNLPQVDDPDAGPPAAVMAETPQGATAFTRDFFKTVNEAYASGDGAAVLRMSHADCNSCRSISGDIERLKLAALQVTGTRFRMDFVETAPFEGDRVIVDFRFDADPYVERRTDGTVARELPGRSNVVGQARLARGPEGWLMYGLRLVEA